MFPLGHLGIGLETARPFRRALPLKPLLLGTLVPDMLDKPLYYGLALATGRHGRELGIVAGTRNFGHTVLLTAGLAGLASMRRSKVLAALALGSATHLLLDLVSDFLENGARDTFKALLWPLLGWQFPFYAKFGLHDHFLRIQEPVIFTSEIIGALLLIREWRRVRLAARL
jgi:hypothetical protein